MQRKPIVDGQFYPRTRDECVNEIKQCLEEAILDMPLPETIVAGIVPHAGWTFSGSVAALVFNAIKKRHPKVDTFIIFGGHSYFGKPPAIYDSGCWLSPLGEVLIDSELASAVFESGTAVKNSEAHSREHGLEVEVPFIQYLFPEAKILPVLTPPSRDAVVLGEIIGSIILSDDERKIVCLGSTDLTHYGPGYGFTPMGEDKDGIKWASEVNDRQFIDLALKMLPQEILDSAAENYNACGPGAAAATVAAAKALGKTKGVLLAHTNSNEIMLQKMGSSSRESVGYAAIIF
jgi:AmmeMemoRadiSam system protein B